jgi:transposase
LGKLKDVHANNDKISAVRIGKAYLSGTTQRVWVPDALTQERRDWFLTYQKAVKRTTQMRNRILSYLSDHGVRLKKGLRLVKDDSAEQYIARAREWSLRQRQVLEGMLMELRHADQQRTHWRSLIAQEVLADDLLLSLVRLCGVRDLVAFALGAIIGDIHRFATPAKLVAYVGLYPAFDDSGQERWRGGIGGHGRKDLRALLIEAAQSILRSGHPLAQWGKKLLARKGSRNLAAAAVARKFTVAIWYLMMGRWSALEEADALLRGKVGKILTQVGVPTLKKLGKKRTEWRRDVLERLTHGRTYILDPNKTFIPKTKIVAHGAAQTH